MKYIGLQSSILVYMFYISSNRRKWSRFQ